MSGFSEFGRSVRALFVCSALLVVACGGGEHHSVAGGASNDAGEAGATNAGGGDGSLGEAGAGSQAVCDGGSVAPVWPKGAKLDAVSGAGAVTLSWPRASGADRYRVYVDDKEIAIVTALTFVAPVPAGDAHQFRVDAAEVCGQVATGPDASASSSGAPDPTESAPPLPTTGIMPFPKAVSFLYTGQNPVQIGTKPGAIDDTRVSVVRGKVTQCDGTPVPGVKVSLPSEPNLGWTFTRSDGSYDLAVNSGCCQVGVQFDASGSPPVQRKVTTPPHDYVAVPDVVIVPYDTKVTTVTLSDTAATSAQGSVTKDSAGTRHATVIFPPGVTASMTLQDGTEVPLPTLNVRATEYTSDACGANAMPSDLPAESAYTYAAELSADEAVQANAKSVNFSKPVALYVDDFLGFPSGTPVPTGYYNRDTQCWQAVPNGVIVTITAIAAGVAAIDVNGDGKADNAATLTKVGITPEETQELAKIYKAGVSLWRTPLAHFSPWDCNWPYAPNGDGQNPTLDPKQQTSAGGASVSPDPCEIGSTIGCLSSSLGETVPIAGANNALVYSTKRTYRPYTIDFPITNSESLGVLKRATIDVTVAGRHFTQTFDPKPNQVYHFSWDGKDGYGRSAVGAYPLTAALTYFYPSSYAPPGDRFADTPVTGTNSRGIPWVYTPARREVALIAQWSGTATARAPAPSAVGGGWDLADTAILDPVSQSIFTGDATNRKLGADPKTVGKPIIETIAGTGKAGFSGDEGPAIDATFYQPWGIALAPDGSLYVSDTENHRIRKITSDGIVHTVAGTGNSGDGPSEGKALETDLFRPETLALDCQGNLYFGDQAGGEFRKLTPDGKLHPLPFRSALYFEGLDGPAASAAFNIDSGPATVVAGSDCRVYFGSGRGPVMRLDPSGDVSLVAGNISHQVTTPQFVENTPARGTFYFGLTQLAYEPAKGSLLIVGDMQTNNAGSESIFRVTPDGLQHLVAGKANLNVVSAGGDGIPAVDAAVYRPTGPALLRDGSIVFIDRSPNGDWIRRVGTDGVISTIAGNGTAKGERIPALGASIQFAQYLAVAPDNTIFIADLEENRIRRIARTEGLGPHLAVSSNVAFSRTVALEANAVNNADSLGPNELAVPDQSGSTVDVFDQVSGQRLRTFDALTGVLSRSFAYDDAGKLTSITDTFGNKTTYAYDDGGKLATVTSPYGLVTTLHYDPDNNLDSVTNPAGEAFHFTYQSGTELLASFQNPAGNVSSFAYDDLGRLSKDSDAAGGSKTVVSGGTANNPTSTVTTALGRSNSYAAAVADDGSISGRTVQRFYGASSSSSTDNTGTSTVTYEGGSSLRTSSDPDPRFGWFTPMATSVVVKSGAQSSTVATLRQYTFADQLDAFSITSFSETNTIDGNAFTRSYDRLGKTVTTKSAVGRSAISKLNDIGQVVEVDHAGVAPIFVTYDERGRPTGTTQGQRATTLSYDDHGYVSKSTDALGQVRQYTYDAVGRALSTQLGSTASAPTISSTYDKDSNLTSLIVPAGPAHSLDYTPVDLLQSYVPPRLAGAAAATPTKFAYNLDRQVTDVTRADGGKLHFDYDSATARTTTVTLPGDDGKIGFTYDDANTKDLLGTSGPSGTSFQLGYTDGLVSSLAWSGAVSGTVRKVYNGKFKLSSESVDGFNGSNSYFYDADGLVTYAGGVDITRESATGRVSGTTISNVSDSRTYDATYGEPNEYKATSFGSTVFDVTYGRDLLGRITDKTETINATTTKYAYAYDDQGRLETVSTNGAVTASYSYDANGNRTERQAGATTELGTYDTQDRLTSYGNAHYTYTDAGDLVSKTVGSAVTSYHYDALDNLRSVTLPSGSVIDYEVDGTGRRVGKLVDGKLVNGYLYRSNSQLKAVLDATGNVLQSFSYGPSQVPLAMSTSTNTYRILTDHLGSVRLVIDVNTGTVAQRLSYDEFGRVTEDTNPGFQPFGYAGGLYEPQSGLVRFGARDYDAQTGRWTTKDPILLGGGFNLYLYVGNDPINLSDATGLLAGVPDWLLWLDDHGVLQAAGDFSAGVSSALTFGLSDKLIGATGLGKYGSKCSGAYFVGNLTGQALFLVGGSLATAAEGAVAEGTEASRVIHFSELGSLPEAAPGTNTVVLGPFSRTVSVALPSGESLTGVLDTWETVLQPAAAQLGGATLKGLPGEMEALAPAIQSADRIIFFTAGKLGSLTQAEMNLVQSSPALRSITTFVYGAIK